MTTPPENRFNRHRAGAYAAFLLYASLAVVYLTIGGAVLVLQKYWLNFPTSMKVAFGILCILYGLFRLYRAYEIYKEKINEVVE